jgi:hypothetical protein
VVATSVSRARRAHCFLDVAADAAIPCPFFRSASFARLSLASFLLLVIPAKAGIQPLLFLSLVIPAKAGIQLLASFFLGVKSFVSPAASRLLFGSCPKSNQKG